MTYDPRQLALDLIGRGFAPVPVPLRGKAPNIPGWQLLRITAETVDRYFNVEDLNVGAIWGPASGDRVDVDLDCKEAVALAPSFLPQTNSIYGRPGKRRSHYLFACSDADPKATIKLLDERKAVIVELRLGGGGKGAQSLMPGSLHHASGERYEWDVDDAAGGAPCAVLKAAITKIAVATILIRHWPALGGRHDAAITVGGFLARAGWGADDIEHFVTMLCRVHGESEDPAAHGKTARDSWERHAAGDQVYGFPQMKETFGDAAAKQIAKLVKYRDRHAAEPAPSDGRPAIMVEQGQLARTVDQAEQTLVDAGVSFYERSALLVRPIVKTVDSFHGRHTKSAQLVRVEQAYMRDMLSRKASWYRLDKRAREWDDIDPPHDIAATLLARAGEWAFPSIAGIITTPTLRPDGTILAAPGFDAATRLLLIDPPPMEPIPDCPTKDDAVKSLELLEGLLTEFPFNGNEVSKSVALSGMITPVARGAFPVVPMIVVDAPVAGSGKSYLLDTTAVIPTGQRMPVITAGRSEEELEKRLGAALLAGQPLVTIDNVVGEIGGSALCQMVERPRPQVRILGRSELVEIEARSVSMFANGNNIVIVGDLCRRVIRVRLDSGLENPETRTFNLNPVAMVLANRGAYIAAALTVCRSYIAAGRPDPRPRLASFEEWSDTVRSALVWLDRADPVDSMDMSRSDDPDRAALMEMHAAWKEVFGTGEQHGVTLKDAIDKADEFTPGSPNQLPTYHNLRLRAAIQAIMPDQRRLTVKDLSYWMRGKRDRRVGGRWFDRKTGAHNESSTWWVEDTANPNSAGSEPTY
jgi:hypothetical protein